ncbi:fibronectin type III domain-containing protein [Mesorhizobium sp. A623]
MMVFPVPPRPSSELLQPRDIDIIACCRPQPKGQQSFDKVYGIRWITRPDIGWPAGGFLVERILGGQAQNILNGNDRFNLPQTDDWPLFGQEISDRRPIKGPYFPFLEITEGNLGHLRPIIRLVDPRVDPSEVEGLTREAAKAFGSSHEDDVELSTTYWPNGPAPPLDDLLADRTTRRPVIAYYKEAALGYLLALAARFEYAVMLGLAADDTIKEGDGKVTYRVSTLSGDASGFAVTEEIPTNRICAPAAPTSFEATRVPGSVQHPAFRNFGNWTPPPELLAQDSNGNVQTAEFLIPRAPSSITALTWSAPPNSGRMIDHEPVLYELARYDHGAKTAAQSTAPAIPPVADFKPLFDSNQMLRSDTAPQALDTLGHPWPEMEGYYHYLIRGIDLLGERSSVPAIASVRHHDDLPPPATQVRLLELLPPAGQVDVQTSQTLDFDTPDQSRDVRLAIRWIGPQDFGGPDAAEFRVVVRWHARRPVHIEILSVTPVADSLHQGDVVLGSLTEPADSLAGARLILPDGEYPIVSHGTGSGAVMRIRRISGRLPGPGQAGLIYGVGEALGHHRIGRVPRRPAVSATVAEVLDTNPMLIRLAAAGAEPLPSDREASVYTHLLRTSFNATYEGGDVWRINAPGADDVRRQSWDAWLTLTSPETALTDSPIILFPPHETTVSLIPPKGFIAGVVMLDVMAADDTAYVDSPEYSGSGSGMTGLKGNESDTTTATVSARVLVPPDAPDIPRYHPTRFTWAETAAKYAEEANYELRWPANGAAHYEIWRVLEGGIPGATPVTSDSNLRTLAAANGDTFTMRSLRVFAGSYRDELPGRAPTRALYRVRGVSEAGVQGPWSDLIGPVHVPDIRQPAAPNFTRIFAPTPKNDDGGEAARQLVLEWNQPGPAADLRFEIERQDPRDDSWQIAGVIPRGALPQQGQLRVFRQVIGGLVPGLKTTFRVTAVREARDPVDPFGQVRRDIRGKPSQLRAAVPLGSLAEPRDLDGVETGGGSGIALSWSNFDLYRSIEVLRKGPEDHRLRRIAAIEGALESYRDSGLHSGTWQYQLRALGHSRKAESEILEVELP